MAGGGQTDVLDVVQDEVLVDDVPLYVVVGLNIIAYQLRSPYSWKAEFVTYTSRYSIHILMQ